jgi:hypothetical protein
MATGKIYFSWFDQFLDTEVDLTAYLERFSPPDNPIEFSNLQPVVMTLKNIFEQVKIADEFIRNNLVGFDQYEISDGERIEVVSNKVYGTKEFWWIIALFNDMTNLFTEWPMTNDQITTLATKLVDEEGIYPYETYFKILFEKNETKRKINLLKQGFVGNFVWDIRKKVIEKNESGIRI